jgi:hypothetical protein
MATVLVDAENVRRSLWPNIAQDRLEELCAGWGDAHGHDVVVVELEQPVWVVTSDRELRERVADHVERVLGGGSFARELVVDQRP